MRRILNVPKRGLGPRAESLVTMYADTHATTFFDGVLHVDELGAPARTATQLKAFRDLMTALREFADAHNSKPSEIVAEVLSKSGLLEELQRSEDPQDASRVENLSQLQSVAAEYEQKTPDATLAGFLETTALVADSDQLPMDGEDSGSVTLMTLHTAKGLEYPVVFLTGLEQGTFPHSRSLEDTSELAEERASGLRGHHARATAPVRHTRRGARPVGPGRRDDAQPVPRRDPDQLIDWKRREAGMERMRGGWSAGGFGDDEFGGWDDDDFGGVSFGGAGSTYGSGSSYGSRGGSSRGYGVGPTAPGPGTGRAGHTVPRDRPVPRTVRARRGPDRAPRMGRRGPAPPTAPAPPARAAAAR